MFAVALLLLCGQSTVDYLTALRSGDGYKLHAKAPGPTLRATSSALRGLRYFGGTVPRLDDVRKFVMSCRDAESGGFADTPGGKPDVILTSVGLMALTELGTPDDKIVVAAVNYMVRHAREFEPIRMTAAGLEAVKRKSEKNADWIAMLAREQNADGTFGKGETLARDTGGKVACLLRLGGTVKDPDAVIKALDGAQREDGGFGVMSSELESTYRIVRTYAMLKRIPARSEDLRGFIAKCRNADGGYGVAPGQPSTVGGTYFAGIVLHWLGKK